MNWSGQFYKLMCDYIPLLSVPVTIDAYFNDQGVKPQLEFMYVVGVFE